MIKRALGFFIAALLMASDVTGETVKSDALLAHGVPNSALLYRHGSGAYMALREFNAIRGGSNELTLYLYALRTPLPNG